MKNTDIALVILISVISILVSYWVGGAILGNPSEKTETTNYLDTISGDLQAPDRETFNPTMINPTEEIIIGSCDPQTQVEDPETHRCMSVEEYEIKKKEEDSKKQDQDDDQDNNQNNDQNNLNNNDNSNNQQGNNNSDLGNNNLEY